MTTSPYPRRADRMIRYNLRRTALAGLILALAAACTPPAGGPLAVGRPVPEWQGELLAGGAWHLGEPGTARLVNLWATWCPPCRAEMPFLQSLHEQYASRGLEVVGITSDGASARSSIDQFIAEAGVGFDIVLDPAGATLDLFGVFGLPATFLVDSDGSIRLIRRGPVGPEDLELIETIEQLVSAP